jgi:tripartite-type tricarboxylate transporter receptor subunit TctC
MAGGRRPLVCVIGPCGDAASNLTAAGRRGISFRQVRTSRLITSAQLWATTRHRGPFRGMKIGIASVSLRGEGNIVKLSRHQFLHLAAGAAALPGVSRIAMAQTYPTRPVRLIVGFATGGVADIAARLIGQWMSERLGQAFVVENRPGAATNIATESVIRASPDGYTLLLVNAANAINAALYDNLKFNFIRDIAPVASIGVTPLVMIVNPSLSAKTVSAFIAYTKTNPGKINYASGGVGSPPHVAGELFKIMTAVSMIHVPYRGDGAAITDLLGGQVQVYFSTLPGAIEYIRVGNLRALAVTTLMRTEALPDIPTVAESLPGFEVSQWVGVGAPKGTPAGTLERLNLAINACLADPRLKARLDEIGVTALPGSPGDFGKLIAAETEKLGKVIRAANIKAE